MRWSSITDNYDIDRDEDWAGAKFGRDQNRVKE